MKLKILIFLILGIFIGSISTYSIFRNYDKEKHNVKIDSISQIDICNPISQEYILQQLKNKRISKSQIPDIVSINICIDIPYSNGGTYNSWKIPTGWEQFIYKNANSEKLDKFSESRFLYITLQGVVFLYLPPAGRYWSPIPEFGDIPPGSVIVGQHVPIKVAVDGGILPVYHGQAYTTLQSLPKKWKDILK
ncbi:hypothetical protein CLTEP_24570 [Clostridium tepidiprofundi DSM 19306]|uniref:Uncharacterized protein n=1 Tax=Clostridium tepidiprofundi DSM 19306 TaxID=1121338 RepID=A0A151ATK0_9CLOT|nr:hypothetical protein [Clostridium tepidiprofundi]KYH30935.1 hypothetical protein CLTEP_24570 [Clostridium tepidiprofundi DSM 19306]